MNQPLDLLEFLPSPIICVLQKSNNKYLRVELVCLFYFDVNESLNTKTSDGEGRILNIIYKSLIRSCMQSNYSLCHS